MLNWNPSIILGLLPQERAVGPLQCCLHGRLGCRGSVQHLYRELSCVRPGPVGDGELVAPLLGLFQAAEHNLGVGVCGGDCNRPVPQLLYWGVSLGPHHCGSRLSEDGDIKLYSVLHRCCDVSEALGFNVGKH